MEARKIAVWSSDYIHERANMMDAGEEGREEERENTERRATMPLFLIWKCIANHVQIV